MLTPDGIASIFFAWLAGFVMGGAVVWFSRARRASAFSIDVFDEEDNMPRKMLPDFPVTAHVGLTKSIQLNPNHPLFGKPVFASNDPSLVATPSDNDPNRCNLQ